MDDPNFPAKVTEFLTELNPLLKKYQVQLGVKLEYTTSGITSSVIVQDTRKAQPAQSERPVAKARKSVKSKRKVVKKSRRNK